VRVPLRLAAAAAAAVVCLVAPAGVASAKEPPNPNDPCSEVGRNTCGTTGVGFYDTYRYGLRWFGDYRGAVPDVKLTFCIDLQYWYPSPKYRFRESTSGTLENREGELVSLENRRRMAYAMWEFGRTHHAEQQAAVMLYVHALMGDARPGEVDPKGVRDSVAAIYDDVARDAARYHGPYRVEVRTAGRLRVGDQGTATIRVLSSTGDPLPDVELTVSAKGASAPSHASTGADGTASVTFRATTAEGASLAVKTEPLASTLPVVYVPAVPAAATNGQRLAAPASQVVTGTSETAAFKAQVRVSSVADPETVTVGEQVHDRVTLSGASESFDVAVTARLYGPFRSAGAIKCAGEPAWEGQWRANGSGEYVTQPTTLRSPGIYVYRQVVPGDAGHLGATSTCTDPRERVTAIAQPRVHTVISDQQTRPGVEITDLVVVEGLAGEQATIQAELFGPYPNPGAIDCAGTPVWRGTIQADGDGEYRTEPVKLDGPGYYTYREHLVASEFVRPAETACAEASETTVVAGVPQVQTKVSKQEARPGAQLTDTLVVSGIGGVEVAVKVDLFGPFATRGGISCAGSPYWTGTLVASGDGTYTTEAATIERVGYYTYRESIPAAPQNAAFTGKCGAQAETTLVRAAPTVSSLVPDEVVAPGDVVLDDLTVAGLGGSQAKIGVELYGPFATRAAIKCTGEPYARGEVYANGDGTIETRQVRLEQAGFYTYVEHLVGTDLVAEAKTECGLPGETVLARPQIITGRNDVTGTGQHAATDPLTPSRVRVASLGIDAPVSPSGIDVKQGVLDVPAQIGRLGWWLDGMTPGSAAGSVLIAGHVDSATAGAGALFRLHEAREGDRVQVTTRNGRTFTYRVTSVQTMPKSELPSGIYSRRGRPRLVLVTCGGTFDSASGHYRDNVVLTAVPV